jgi:hypothetical protein
VSINHLRIHKTDKGRFALVQLDKAQKRVAERHGSGDLEEMIDQLLDRHEKNSAQGKRARDYAPVLESIKNLSRDYPCVNDEDFPANWTDSLDLYGCLLQELARFRIDMDSERKKLASLIFDSGPEWVWKNRLRLVAEKVVSLNSPGDQEPPAESMQQCK